MLPSRYAPQNQLSAARKSRLETQRPSMLPKPRRPGSTDRLSNEARRPSAAGQRSSSAEPARATFGVGRLSREASATKLPINRRSKSQQSDKFRTTSMTPLRSSQYSRPTTTPQRSPSVDRGNRNWQTSLERALAFVTVKDQRPISTVAWQRSECARVSEALSSRGEGGGMALMRPLTIARFVDIASGLVTAIARDAKLNTDNYVTKLPHLAKRLLYPGTVSKSWLKTVNTLHAFPHALALIAYLLDLVTIIEMPVSDDWLYVDKDEVSCYRREYLYKCWIRFQDPGHDFEDLNEEYLHNLKQLFGNDDEKIAELNQVIKKYEARLKDDDEDVAAREAEARLVSRRDALLASLRAVRAARQDTRALCGRRAADTRDLQRAASQLDVEIERATVDLEQLKTEIETQPMTVEQRTKLLEDVEYAGKVQESKHTLAEKLAKMVVSRETELAVWQTKTLDSCVQYKQGLIHLSTQFPDLAALAIDENELMGAECAGAVAGALELLRARAQALVQRRHEHSRERSALARRRAALLEEVRLKIAELKLSVQHEQEALDCETSQETLDACAATAELRAVSCRLQELKGQQEEHARVGSELKIWEEQDQLWRTRLQALQETIRDKRLECQRVLERVRQKRTRLVLDCIAEWNENLDAVQ